MNKIGGMIVLSVLLLAGTAMGEEIYFQGQNQIEASKDDKRDRETVEEWLDLDFYGGPFSLGIQWSAFPKPDPTVSDPDVTGFEQLTHRYAELEWGSHRLRVGTYTQLFGRGLALRSYENRDLRLDNNLDGFLYELSLDSWQLIFLRGLADTGPMEHYARSHDASVTGLDLQKSLGDLTLGSSVVNHDTPGEDSHMGLHTLRGSYVADLFQLDYEGGYRFGDGVDGQGHVVEASAYLGPFSFFGGYKHYEQFDSGLNQAPVLIRDQRATLLNRNPHQLHMNSEKGYLLDLSANTPLGSFLASYSFTEEIEGHPSENDFEEAFLEWDQFFSGDFLLAAHAIIDLQSQHTNTPLDEIVDEQYLTFATDLRLGLGSFEMLLEWEHQHKDSEYVGEYDDDFFVAEVLAPNGWSLAVLGEFLNWSEEQQELEGEEEIRDSWGGVQLAGPIGDMHELRLFAGGRRAGYICIGGVCRYEPAFDGVELTLITRF